MTGDLPASVRRDLDRAAAGIGRTPTTAHPECRCGQPTGRLDRNWADVTGNPIPLRYGKADCPQHCPLDP